MRMMGTSKTAFGPGVLSLYQVDGWLPPVRLSSLIILAICCDDKSTANVFIVYGVTQSISRTDVRTPSLIDRQVYTLYTPMITDPLA